MEKLPDDLQQYAGQFEQWPHIEAMRLDVLRQIAEHRKKSLLRRAGSVAMRGLRWIAESYEPKGML